MSTLALFQPAEVAPAAFDYSGLGQEVETEARAIVERVRRRNEAFLIDTGRDLLAMKERIEHGRFVAWVETELNLTARTAQNYMQAAERFGDKSEIVSLLPPTTIYALAAPSTPEPVRQEIVAQIAAGESLAPAVINARIRKARDEVKAKSKADAERAAWEKLTPEEQKAQNTKAKRTKADRERQERQWAKERQETTDRQFRTQAAALSLGDLLADLLSADELERVVGLMDQTEGYYFDQVRKRTRERLEKTVPTPSASIFGESPVSA